MLVQYSGRNGSINQLKGLTKDENFLYIKLKKCYNKSTSLCIFLLVKGTLFYLKKKLPVQCVEGSALDATKIILLLLYLDPRFEIVMKATNNPGRPLAAKDL